MANYFAVCDADGSGTRRGSSHCDPQAAMDLCGGSSAGAFVRSEFQVVVSNWTVTGTGQGYSIAGPGSRRIEDNSNQVHYAGTWTTEGGNYSGGTIHYTSVAGSSISCTYTSSQDHSLYLGTRLVDPGTLISIVVDAGSPFTFNLNVPSEDVLIRTLLGQLTSGTHTVTVTQTGATGTYFYFDFLEIAILSTTPPPETVELSLAAATDWDTNHSLALAPERTAGMIYVSRLPGPRESLCRRAVVL